MGWGYSLQNSDLRFKRTEDHDSPGCSGESPPESSRQGGKVEKEEDKGANWGWHNALPHLEIRFCYYGWHSYQSKGYLYFLTSNRKGRCRGSRLVAWDKGEVQATPSGPAEIRIRKEIFYMMMFPLFRIDAYLPRA